MAKKSVVHLRVYKGSSMAYDANKNPLNENQIVKIQHGSFEWINFMKMAVKNGYCKVKVEKVIIVEGFGEDEKITQVNETSSIEAEVEDAINPKQVVVLTDDQKRIKELEDKINSMLNDNKSKSKGSEKEKEKEIQVKDANDVNDYPVDPVELKSYYEGIMGKKAHHKASNETLIEQMEELKNKS